MFFAPDNQYHIYNRGNNRIPIFYKEENYFYFLRKMQTQLAPYCDLLCWCLMPNHFHLIINANEFSCKERAAFGGKPIQELTYRIGTFLSSYAQAINKQNNTTGSLFQQKTKAKSLDTKPQDSRGNYLVNAMHYVHQNPWKAGLVKKIEEWPFSSFPDYCGFRNGKLCNKDLMIALTGYDLNSFYSDSYNTIEGYDEKDFL